MSNMIMGENVLFRERFIGRRIMGSTIQRPFLNANHQSTANMILFLFVYKKNKSNMQN